MVAHALQKRSTINTWSSWDRQGMWQIPKKWHTTVRERGRKSFVLAGKNKWRQSGPKEIKLRNGRGRGVNFPDLLSYKLLFGENEAQRKKWAGSKWWRALKASPELFVITEIKHLDDWSLHPDIWHYPNTGLRILRFKKKKIKKI